MTPPEVVETLVGGIAGANVTTIDHAAHLACVEQPGAFGAAVLAHLTREVPV
jgi:pimeloyl-ACP methyl ester carboxylesterase